MELVLGKGCSLQSSDQHSFGKQVWFIWAAECPRASPSHKHPPSHHSQPLSPVPHQVLVRAALLLFSSLSQENLSKLWSVFSP